MIVTDYRTKLMENMAQVKDYESIGQFIDAYMVFLKDVIKDDPQNVQAICQLAIARLERNQDTDESIAIMEEALGRLRKSMSEGDLCVIMNNLAFFYDEEKDNSDRAKALLTEIIPLGSCHDKTHYALAYLLAKASPGQALKVINKIDFTQGQPDYMKHLWVYILVKNKSYEKALNILEDLYITSKTSDMRDIAFYMSAIVNHVLNRNIKALAIANRLYSKYVGGEDTEISTIELVHLYFLLEEYDKVVEIYERDWDMIYLNTEDMEMLLYALNKLGHLKRAESILRDKISQIEEDSSSIQNDDDFTQEEKVAYIQENDAFIEALHQSFEAIMSKTLKVKVKDVFYGCQGVKSCYLIGCLRHD